MKLYLDESKFNRNNLNIHYWKHRNQYRYDPRFKDVETEEEAKELFDSIGDELSNAKAGSPFSDDIIVGFINKQGRVVKYNRSTGDYIVFNGDDSITLHKKLENQFRSNVRRDFLDELPENK